MKKLTLLVAILAITLISFAQGNITYVLNGGITNDYGWATSQDMFAAFMTDAGASGFETLEYYKAQLDPLGAPNICSKLTNAAPALTMEKWAWLKSYIKATHEEQAANGASALTTDGTGAAWRYAVGAFFIDGQRNGWPQSADFTKCGVSNYNSYKDYWKHGFIGPTSYAKYETVILPSPYPADPINSSFVGWYIDKECTQRIKKISGTGDVTVYAKYGEYIATCLEVSLVEDDSVIKVEGVVSQVQGNNFWIQDETGGLLCYHANHSLIAGEQVVLKGTKTTYGGIPYLGNIIIEAREVGTPILPQNVLLADIFADTIESKYTSKLVKINGAFIKYSEDGTNVNPILHDGKFEIPCYKITLDPTAMPTGTKVTATLIVSEYFGKKQFRGSVENIMVVTPAAQDPYPYPDITDSVSGIKYNLISNWQYSYNLANWQDNRPNPIAEGSRSMIHKDGILYFLYRDSNSPIYPPYLVRVNAKSGKMIEPIYLADNIFKKNGNYILGPFNDLKTDSAGHALVSNISLHGTDFQIWTVDLSTGSGNLLVDLTQNGRMLKDIYPEYLIKNSRIERIGVYGDISHNAIIMAAVTNNTIVFYWNIYNGQWDGQTNLINLQIDETMAGSPQIVPIAKNRFYVDGSNTHPLLFDIDGNLLDKLSNYPNLLTGISGKARSSGHNGVREFKVNNNYYILCAGDNTAGSSPSTFVLYKFKDSNKRFSDMTKLYEFPYAGMGGVSNPQRVAVSDVKVAADGKAVDLFVFTAENGYGSYTIHLTQIYTNLNYQSLGGDSVEVIAKSNGTKYEGDVVIPETVLFNGKMCRVVSIGNSAFYGCSNLTSVTIPESITTIGDAAFSGCSNLGQITVPLNVKSIGTQAFYNCSSLKTIHWNVKKPTNVGSSLFGSCGNISSFTFGDSVQVIPNSLCYNLSKISTITIPESVVSIGNSAFYRCSNLTSVTIPESITTIGDAAFSGCSNLGQITVPLNVKSIGTQAFYNCSSLKTIHWNVKKPTSVGSSLFGSCGNISSFAFGDSVQVIPNSLCYNLSKISTIAIPESVTSIGNSVFDNCTALKTIHWNAVHFNDLNMQDPNDAPFYNIRSQITSFTFGNAIEIIPSDICYGMAITNIDIPNSVQAIHASAFRECNELTTITLPLSLDTIGQYAFYQCDNLAQIDIPNKVSYIGDYAFACCTSMKSVSLGENVSTIGSNTFKNCTSLNTIVWNTKYCTTSPFDIQSPVNSVVFGESVTVIPNGLCQNFKSLSSITIPKSVVSIYQDAFKGCDNLRKTNYTGDIVSWCNIEFANEYSNPINYSGNLYINDVEIRDIVIPDTIQEIKQYAFIGDSVLMSVRLPKNLNKIGDWAFASCVQLSDLMLPNKLEYIGDGAFTFCHGLKSITIPETVKTMGCNVFAGSSGLKKVQYNAINCQTINQINTEGYWCPIFINCDNFTTLEIGDKVENIPDYLFFNASKITALTLPRNLKAIGQYAFATCESLSSITIPENITTIGRQAFAGCVGLKTIHYNAIDCRLINSTAENGNIYPMFMGCDSLTMVAIGNPVESIPAYLFINVSTVGALSLPNSLKSIGNSAFRGWNSLDSVAIPENVTRMGNNVFASCSGLKTVQYNAINCWTINQTNSEGSIYPTFINCNNLTRINIGNKVERIPDYLFYSVKQIQSIDLPNSLRVIGSNAFRKCENLRELILPNNLTFVDSLAFANCTALQSVTIGKNVREIGLNAFNECTNLQKTNYLGDIAGWCNLYFENYLANPIVYSENLFINDIEIKDVIIPEGVTYIGRNVFNSCKSIKSVTLPESLTEIRLSAFGTCTNLTSIIIPNNVRTIEGNVFYGCSRLQSVKIGKNVTSIATRAFQNCYNLTYITSLASTPPSIGSNAFYDVPTAAGVTVPCGVAPSYRVAIGWSRFSHIEEKLIYTFTVSSQDETTGLVQTLQTPSCELPAIIKALPMEGYKFLTWSDGNTLTTRQITVDRDINLSALFTPINGSADVTDVTVVPTDSTAAFTWPAVEGAASYTLIIWADESQTERICTLTFDAAGRLTNLDFSKRNAPRQTTTGLGLNFTVTGLDENTTYGFTLESKTTDEVILNTTEGTFTTTGDNTLTIIGIVKESKDSVRKVFHNGTIYILKPNGDTFTIDGRKVN